MYSAVCRRCIHDIGCKDKLIQMHVHVTRRLAVHSRDRSRSDPVMEEQAVRRNCIKYCDG